MSQEQPMSKEEGWYQILCVVIAYLTRWVTPDFFGIRLADTQVLHVMLWTVVFYFTLRPTYKTLRFFHKFSGGTNRFKHTQIYRKLSKSFITGVVPLGIFLALLFATRFYVTSDQWESIAIAGLATGVIAFAAKKFFPNLLTFWDLTRLGAGGSARFCGFFEEQKLRYKKGALFMGRSLFNNQPIGLISKQHMITIGGTRAGKGTNCIIPNLLLWEGSALVIDPKGTNAHVTAEARRKMGHAVHIVDPFGIYDENTSSSFNPLSELDLASISVREDILVIVECLIVKSGKQENPYFDNTSYDIVSGVIAHVASHPDYEGKRNLATVYRLLTDKPENQAALWIDMSDNEEPSNLAREAGNSAIELAGTDTYRNVMSTVRQHMNWLGSRGMQRILHDTSFTIREMKDRPTTIYLILPPQLLDVHKRFLRLFVDSTVQSFSSGGRAQTPVLFLLDEFYSMGRMSSIARAFSLMASYNMILWPFIQDWGQLTELYGDKMAQTFINNSRAVQVFGVDDDDTRKFVSSRLGDRSLGKISKIDRSNQNLGLRHPTDISKEIGILADKQYVMVNGGNPLLLRRIQYFKDRMFKGKAGLDPDYAQSNKRKAA